jgi:HupE / UreJ protein
MKRYRGAYGNKPVDANLGPCLRGRPSAPAPSLVLLATSFTVAHSISLIAAAFGFVPDALWFPPLVETLIATTSIQRSRTSSARISSAAG